MLQYDTGILSSGSEAAVWVPICMSAYPPEDRLHVEFTPACGVYTRTAPCMETWVGKGSLPHWDAGVGAQGLSFLSYAPTAEQEATELSLCSLEARPVGLGCGQLPPVS